MARGVPISVEGGRAASLALNLTITRGKMVAIDILADPDRLRRLDLTVLRN